MVSPSNLRWVMIALVFFATVINYLDRQALSVVAPVLIEIYHMSNVTYSRIIFAFMLAYTLMNGVTGPIIDRVGTRAGYFLTTAWWSAAAMLHAATIGPWSLGTFRFLLGMGEAGNWPAGVKVVAEWFPAPERALASGIFNSGSAIGAISAGERPSLLWEHRDSFGSPLGCRSITVLRTYHMNKARPESHSANCWPPDSSGCLPAQKYSWIRSGISTFSGFRLI